MAGKTANKTEEPTATQSRFAYDAKSGGLDLDNVLDQALAAGGKLADEDRISGASDSFPLFTVVGPGSKDAEEWDEDREENISRAGKFRFREGGEVKGYHKTITPVVVLHASGAQALIEGNEVTCRGRSTQGIYNPACVGGALWNVGQDCKTCPFYQFAPEGSIDPRTNKPIDKTGRCSSQLDLHCWDPEGDPAGERIFVIGFSSSSFKAWREWASKIENRGAKLWSLALAVSTQKNDPTKSGQSAFYTPKIAILGVLSPAEVALAEELRQTVLQRLAPSNIVPVKALTAPTQAALPGVIQAEDPFGKQ